MAVEISKTSGRAPEIANVSSFIENIDEEANDSVFGKLAISMKTNEG